MKRLAALAFAFFLPALAGAQYNSYTAYPAGGAPSYEGLWWNPSESGWGLSLAHQGDILFAVWYTFDHDGSPMWLVMPEARLESDDMYGMMGMGSMEMMGMTKNAPVYTGTLYRSSRSGKRIVMTEVGMATVLFKDRANAVFAYTVGSVSQAKNVTRMAFAPGAPECTLGGPKGNRESYQDLWWNPSDQGWGLNIAHQGDTLFATYFTYDENGKGEWLVASNAARSDGSTYAGPLMRARGPSFDSRWDASKVSLDFVATATLSFKENGTGVFLQAGGSGQSQLNPMERMSFALPASVCR